MSPRIRQILIGVVAVAVIVVGLWMLLGNGAGDANRDGSPAASDSRGANTKETDADGDASKPGSSEEESVGVISDAPAKPDDRISNEIAYELIDALKAAGIEPVAGQPLTLEYVGRLDRVRVAGTFQSREATSFVLEFDDGAWKVDE